MAKGKKYIGADDALNAGLILEVAPTVQKEILADSQGRYIGNGYTVDDLNMVGTGQYMTATDWNKMGDGYSIVTNPYQAASPEQIAKRQQGSQVSTNRNDMELMSDDAYSQILKYQQDWANATTDAERQAAHEAAEAIRAKYGYSGGADGSEYLGLMTYTENSGYNDDRNKDDSGFGYNDTYNGGNNEGVGGFSYDPYKSQYQARIDALTDAILNREAFAYDKEQDPLYQQYKASYTRAGQRGMQDTLAQISARTGGLASSYAQSAAQQTYNNFMAELADKVPELQQLAYGQYMDNLAMDRAELQMLMGLDDTAYGRWSDALNFDYGAYRDNVSDSQWEKNFAYGAYRDNVGDNQWAQQFAYQQAQDALAQQNWQTQLDYQRAQDALAQQNWQTQWDYQLQQDELARQDALAKLQAAASGNPGYRYTVTPTAEETAESGVIPSAMLTQLQATYADGNMPAEAWNAAVGLYGEEAMTAAGFRQQQTGAAEVSDYQFVVNNLNKSKREGVSYKDILYDLESARKDGLLTEAEYQTLKKLYAE